MLDWWDRRKGGGSEGGRDGRGREGREGMMDLRRYCDDRDRVSICRNNTDP